MQPTIITAKKAVIYRVIDVSHLSITQNNTNEAILRIAKAFLSESIIFRFNIINTTVISITVINVF